jgi:SusD family.
MEDYLYIKDGKAVPFNTVAGYDKALYADFYKNRDPRLSSTFWLPGMKRLGVTTPYAPSFDVGGYPQYKYYPRTLDQNSYGGSYSDIAIIRYAEILLIEAEAKAELGTLTQDDLDKTVNLLRNRAGVPAAYLSEWNSNIDHAQEVKYPNVSGAMKGAILEIRRERRVELACEGFRSNDLNRWACGERFAIQAEGIFIPEGGQVDLTGDGNIDATFAESDAVALTNGTSGHIISKAVKAANMTFHSPKDYYSPISSTEMALSPNLVQNQYWK